MDLKGQLVTSLEPCQHPKHIIHKLKKEGLVCVFGVKKFHAYFYGQPFILYTDRLPLQSSFQEHTKVLVQGSG